MPPLTRWTIKAAMLCLVASGALALLDAARPLAADGLVPRVSDALVVHLLVVGWLTQLIFGVAYWMFPTYSKSHPYRSERTAWFMFAALNAGLLLRAVGELGAPALSDDSVFAILAASAALQWLAGAVFVVNTWGRARPHHARTS